MSNRDSRVLSDAADRARWLARLSPKQLARLKALGEGKLKSSGPPFDIAREERRLKHLRKAGRR